MPEAETSEEIPWTFVTSKRHRLAGTPKPPTPTTHPAPVASSADATPAAAQLSVEEIRTTHEKFARQWTESDSCLKLKELMSVGSGRPTPTKALCFGLGSFDPADGSWQVRRKSHIQLAAFATLVESLPAGDKKIRCIFQEPCLTNSDKEFLLSLGNEILESPAGFDEVSDDSLVYGLHLYKDIYAQIVEKAIPAIFIGTPYEVWESVPNAVRGDDDSTSARWERMKELDQLCDKQTFPDDKEFRPIFSGTTIHWRGHEVEP